MIKKLVIISSYQEKIKSFNFLFQHIYFVKSLFGSSRSQCYQNQQSYSGENSSKLFNIAAQLAIVKCLWASLYMNTKYEYQKNRMSKVC